LGRLFFWFYFRAAYRSLVSSGKDHSHRLTTLGSIIAYSYQTEVFRFFYLGFFYLGWWRKINRADSQLSISSMRQLLAPSKK